MVMICVSCLFRHPPNWVIHGAYVDWSVYSFIYLEIFILSSYCTRQGSFFFLIFIGVLLLYHVVLVCAIQQIESAVCLLTCPILGLSSLFRLPQSVESRSPCCIVGSH